MKTFGEFLKDNRKARNYTLLHVSVALRIDSAIISKIESGKRTATRKQVKQFVSFLNLNEKDAFSKWLSDKIVYDLQDEDYALEAFRVAEEQIKYKITKAKKSQKLAIELVFLLKNVDKLQKTWSSLKPLNKTQLEKMREYFMLNYTFESNLIEGNTLTLQETHLVVNEGLTISGKSMKEHLEAVNHYEAIDFIMDLVKNKEPFTQRILKEIHYLILKGIDRTNAGVYRRVPVVISGSAHKPPQPYLIDKQMEDVFEFYAANKNKMHPVILASEMHQKIVTVHPFIDGNGRTCRLIMNLILLQNGYTIANLKGNNIARLTYYKALENIQINDSTLDFHSLIINTSIDSLKEHIELAG
ncbi:MAG TPA: DNA-binding protein [Flavobacteriaceae bacterium]|nr:DNA-binding protein [Flavobacteriaceae bacterium]HIP27037.1 DNA-binding protein [Flavobacteriaceae bacterium]